MRNLLVFLMGVSLLCSAFGLFSKATWGEPIGVDSLKPDFQGKAAIQEEVRAKRFVLVNEHGTPLGALGVIDGQLSFKLMDQNKKVRLVLALDPNGQPGVVLADENERIRAQFDLEENEPRLMLLDENGKVVFQAPQWARPLRPGA